MEKSWLNQKEIALQIERGALQQVFKKHLEIASCVIADD